MGDGEMSINLKKTLSVIIILLTAFLMFAQIALAAPTYEEEVKPYAVILMDAKSGAVLYAKNADQEIVPASTTKIMTCLLGLEYGNLSSTVVVSRAAARVGGSTFDLVEGEEVVFSDMLIGLMMCSGNDAAVAIAEHIGGSVDGFVDMMNAKAREIGMSNTHFVNPNGLPGPEVDEVQTNNVTTAQDMAKLAMYAMKNATFMEIVGYASFEIPANNKKKKARTINTTNRLLRDDRGANYPYATGMKTGFTNAAGNCLVATAKKDGMELVCLVYKDDSKDGLDRWPVATSLLEFGFDNFVTKDLDTLLKDVPPVTVQVENHALTDMGGGRLGFEEPEEGIFVTISKTVERGLQNGTDTIRTSVEWASEGSVMAPVHKGDLLGTVTYKSAKTGDIIYQGNLIAERDVYEIGSDQAGDEGPMVTEMKPVPPELIPSTQDNMLIWLWLLIPGGLVIFLVIRLMTANKTNRRRMTRRKPKYSYKIKR